jgi:ribosomal protein S18 acetylase RimI-like enzyme
MHDTGGNADAAAPDMSGITLRHAESEGEVLACFPVMAQLRPHLADAAEFAARVARQRNAGYRLLAAWRGETPVALAGYRVVETLVHGRFLYVDDLVTAERERRQRHGARLLDAVMEEGRRLGCRRLVLDTAIDNALGHRFYYRQGLLARALRFSREIAPS